MFFINVCYCISLLKFSFQIDTLVNPLKSGMKTIKNMPEQFINTVDEVVEGLTKVFHSKSYKFPEASKVGAGIEEVSYRQY